MSRLSINSSSHAYKSPQTTCNILLYTVLNEADIIYKDTEWQKDKDIVLSITCQLSSYGFVSLILFLFLDLLQSNA